MRIDNFLMEAFSSGPLIESIRPEGMSLRVRFLSSGGQGVEIKVYPAGEAPAACGRGKRFDVVFQPVDGEPLEGERLKLLEMVVEKLLALDPPIGVQDWEETVGDEADRRFLCGSSAEIKVTRKCNQKCIFCKSSERIENYATAASMPALLRRLAQRTSFLTLSGGETCLDPLLDRHIKMAREAGFKQVEVQTNGILMRDRSYVRRLVRAGMTNALVSLHSDNETVSDTITCCPGGFKATLEGIETLLSEGVQVSLCYVICSLNYNGTARYVDFVTRRFMTSSIGIVFTLAIPTFRVRENPHLMPKLSQLAPPLKEGLSKCVPPKEERKNSVYDKLAAKVGRMLPLKETTTPLLRRLLSAGSRLLLAGRPTARIISHCGIPLCAVNGFEAYHDDYKLTGGVSFPADYELFKPPSCRPCRWYSRCSGIWRAYSALYGDSELSPR